jgi:hypothetical protein
MLNISFDVPVKLGAGHVLLAAATLLLPDATRLMRLFLLNQPTEPADLGPHWPGKARVLIGCVKALVIGGGLVYLAWDASRAHDRQAAAREVDPVPPEGWYRVESITRDGEEVPKASPDELRWKSVSFRRGRVGLRGFDGSVHRFRMEGEIGQGPMTLFPVDEQGEPVPGSAAIGYLTLNVGDGDAASLSGVFACHRVDAVLQRQNPTDLPLMSRGFRWIIEEPYFR